MLNFSLINNEQLTEETIKCLKEFNFYKIDIDRRKLLTFIIIEDKNYDAFITRIFFDNEIQLCLHIYKIRNEISIDIPLKIIQTIDNL